MFTAKIKHLLGPPITEPARLRRALISEYEPIGDFFSGIPHLESHMCVLYERACNCLISLSLTRIQDPEKILSTQFPLNWIRSHPNVTFPKSTEIVASNVLRQQFNLNEEWFATNWSGVCSQLAKISIPTLVIAGTEDVAVPIANSLILAQKIPDAWLVLIKGGRHGLCQYPDIFDEVVLTFLSTTSNPD
jgi:pimeloyl-ACP methyl ester carboxylesterase